MNITSDRQLKRYICWRCPGSDADMTLFMSTIATPPIVQTSSQIPKDGGSERSFPFPHRNTCIVSLARTENLLLSGVPYLIMPSASVTAAIHEQRSHRHSLSLIHRPLRSQIPSKGWGKRGNTLSAEPSHKRWSSHLNDQTAVSPTSIPPKFHPHSIRLHRLPSLQRLYHLSPAV